MICLSNVWLHILISIGLSFVDNHIFSHYFYEIVGGAQASIGLLNKSTEDIRHVVFELISTFKLLSVATHCAHRVMTPFKKLEFWLLLLCLVLRLHGYRA